MAIALAFGDVELHALGPVTLAGNGPTRAIEVGKHRALLAMLALHGHEMTSNAELVDALWGDEPPATATKTLQGYVSALRGEYGHDLIRTLPGGYALGPAVEHVDVATFEHEIVAGRTLLEQEQARAARRAFGAALHLWRGHPLDDFADGAMRSGQTARLAELRILAIEGTIEADLALGHHRDVVPELEQLVNDHPYREVLWRALMLALYRSGRTPDALRAYTRLRSTLVEAFGLEPSSDTQELQHRILDQDPALDLPPVAPPTNLPARLDSFVDRTAERAAVVSLLGEHRFVTVLGVGGVGKSRLANEVGRALLDDTVGGVWWIDLAAANEGVSLVDLVASVVDLDVSPAGSAEAALLTRLRRAPALLVLDNCEHLRAAAATFVEWITTNAPLVRVLATSRTTLDVPGVAQLVLEPLALDGDAAGRTRADVVGGLSDAGRLFVDRLAERVEVHELDPADADTIVRLVDGLPLGVELAAAQCVTTSPSDLARTLHDRRVLLSMTDLEHADERHASLQRVLDASLETIPPALATQLAMLAVFPGDFELAAAAAVLRLPTLEAEQVVGRLLTASLLSGSSTSTPQRRFRVLWPIRELTAGRLTAADRRAAQERHAQQFRAVAAAFLDAIDTPAESQRIDVVGTERHNMSAALGWFDEHDADGALVFGPALGLERQLRGDQHEGRDLLRRLLDRAEHAPDSHVAWTEETVVWPEFLSGDIDDALAHNEDAITRFEALGDARGLCRALRSRAHALHLGGADEAITTPLYQRSIEVARAADLEFSMTVSQVEFAHSLTASERFDVVDIESMLSDAEDVLRNLRDHAQLAHAALSRGFIAFSRDDAAAVRAAGETMLHHSRLARARMWEQVAMIVLGAGAHQEGNRAESARWLHGAVHLARDTDNHAQLGIALHALAATCADRAPEAAARLWGFGDTLGPTWPLFVRRYGEWLTAARVALGGRFDDLVAEGAQLSLDDAILLADSLT